MAFRLLVLAVLLGAIFAPGMGARPVAACSCAGPFTEADMRGMLDYYPLVVEGSLTDRTYSDRTEYVHLAVERSYAGDVPELITLDQLWRTHREFQSPDDAEVQS